MYRLLLTRLPWNVVSAENVYALNLHRCLWSAISFRNLYRLKQRSNIEDVYRPAVKTKNMGGERMGTKCSS